MSRPTAGRWLMLDGIELRRLNGRRCVQIAGQRYWFDEADMKILRHDEMLGDIEFQITKEAATLAGLK